VNTGQSPPGPEMENPRVQTEGSFKDFRSTNTSHTLVLQALPFRCARIVRVKRCLPAEEWQQLRWEAEGRGVYGFNPLAL
jgi:hypothetical protein